MYSKKGLRKFGKTILFIVKVARKSIIMSILICFALKEEAAPFRKIVAKMATAQADISILLTGIGRQNAEKSLREFLSGGASVPASRSLNDQARLVSSLTPPELVLTCGFAGGLNPDLKLGEAVFELTGLAANDQKLVANLAAVGAKPAKFFCADRIATTIAEKKKLRAETGADAVEMESAAIHTVCREHGIPCATIRAISDTANEDLPLDFNALSKPDKNLDYGKLFLAIARSPGKIGALMQLQKKTKFAAEKIAEVLAKITFP
jgi:adenosylhomocysteine nucleosidase